VFERLARLSFVTRGGDGLIVHEIVRQAIAENLHAADPNRYHRYRYLAYRQYRRELQTVGPADAWRYTADFLYMMEEPVIREAFFPSDSQAYTIETAESADHADIVELARRHESAEAAALTAQLLERLPRAFRAVRDSGGRIEGYYIVFDPKTVPAADFRFDPVLKNWWDHLQQKPIPDDQHVLFLRRWLGVDGGERPSPVQAACWLDVKGDYVRMRSVLRRCYVCAVDAGIYAPILDRLGFELLDSLATNIGSNRYQTAMLDFGPGLFLGWLDRHVQAALQVGEDLLDLEARELVVGENRVSLTPLEFGVIAYLSDHEGKAVSRDTLLDRVWGREYHGGSNVVDARIRDLRKKLGPLSTAIETVTGVGYRFRHPGH
jgi:DNA-binding response OmpR family regulator